MRPSTMPRPAESGYARVGTANRLLSALWLCAATAWLLFQLGYSFETNDQVQYLLLPYRDIYPDFLPGDWFTWSTSHYHLTFAWIVRALHALFGEAYFRYAMLAAHVASLALVAWSCLRLARSLGGGALEASLPVLVFASAHEVGLGGALLNHGCLVPADLAYAPFLLACAACLDRRPLATGVWLGIAGFLHANFAVLGPLVVLPVALWHWQGDVRSVARTCGVYAVLASPSLWLLATSFLARDADPAAVAITLFVRSPHHYDLALMSPLKFYWAGVLAIVSVPAWMGPYALPRRAAAAGLCGLLVALIALGVIAAWLHIVPLARLFLFRLSIPLFVIWLIVVAHVARSIVGRRDWGAIGWAITAFAVLAIFVREDLLVLSPFRQPPQLDPHAPGPHGWIAVVLLPLLAATAFLAAAAISPIKNWPRRQLAIAALAAVPLLVSLRVATIPLGQIWTGTRLRQAHAFHFAGRTIALEPPDREIYRKVRELTPNDARFLIAPGLFEFRMRARRAVFVDWKCAPMRGDEAREWKRRMLAAMGAPDFPSRGFTLPARSDALYYARPATDLLALARRESMNYVVLRRTQLGKSLPGARVAFTTGAWAVLELE